MALGSTQPLTEMSTRCISWGKDGRRVRLTTLPPSCAVVTKSGRLNFLEPSGPLQACNGTAVSLPYTIYIYFRRTQQIFNIVINKCYMFRSLIDDKYFVVSGGNICANDISQHKGTDSIKTDILWTDSMF